MMADMFAGKRLLLALLTLTLTLFGVGAGFRAPALAAAPELCAGAYQGDNRLGPETLPKPWQRPVGPIVAGYKRFGNLSKEAFLAKYWNGTGWNYPPQDGFKLRPNGEPIKWKATLTAGRKLDRFGSEFGGFLAPKGSHYSTRAIPPQSLYTFDPAYRCNYHAYKVTKAFAVWEGPIAPWFEQIGGGQQQKLDRALVPGDGALNVAWLLSNGYLVRIN